jgi:hypothetical protein
MGLPICLVRGIRLLLYGLTKLRGRPPHQIMAWVGLERYGYLEEAQRLAYRFLYMFVKTPQLGLLPLLTSIY